MPSKAAGSVVQEAHGPSPALGFAFVAVVGTLWHFAYDLSGGFWLVGLVAPVNESVWEHTKLVSVPILAWAAWTARHPGRDRTVGRSPVPLAAVVAALSGSAIIVVGFYAYVAVLGADQFVLDIALFLVAAWIAIRTFDVMVQVGPAPHPVLGIMVVVGLMASLAVLTVAPPDWPMFHAP